MKVQVQFPGPDVRLSELPDQDWKAVVFPGPDVRLVEFPPAPMPIVEGIAHFTGSGSARSTLFAVAIIHSAFASEGSASASVFAFGGVKFVDAAFAGVGGLSVASAAAAAAPMSGEGALDTQFASASEMAMSGGGSLAVESTFIGLVPADFASEGTIGASVIAVGGAYDMPANFTGEGSATAKVVPAITAGFTGSGSASAASASAIKSLFSGSGSIAAKSIPAASMLLSGTGAATASVVSGPTISAYTTFSKTTGSAVTITLPTASVGDLWVIAMATTSGQMGSTPSGWTKRMGNGAWYDGAYLEVWTRTKVAGDPATITTSASGFSSDSPTEVIAMTVANQAGVNASSSILSDGSATATPHPTPAITTTVARAVLIRMVSTGQLSAAHTWPAGVTPVTTVINGTSAALSVAVQTGGAAGSQAAVNATPSNGSKYSSGTIAISPT